MFKNVTQQPHSPLLLQLWNIDICFTVGKNHGANQSFVGEIKEKHHLFYTSRCSSRCWVCDCTCGVSRGTRVMSLESASVSCLKLKQICCFGVRRCEFTRPLHTISNHTRGCYLAFFRQNAEGFFFDKTVVTPPLESLDPLMSWVDSVIWCMNRNCIDLKK